MLYFSQKTFYLIYAERSNEAFQLFVNFNKKKNILGQVGFGFEGNYFSRFTTPVITSPSGGELHPLSLKLEKGLSDISYERAHD